MVECVVMEEEAKKSWNQKIPSWVLWVTLIVVVVGIRACAKAEMQSLSSWWTP